jgi:hypothetical protein
VPSEQIGSTSTKARKVSRVESARLILVATRSTLNASPTTATGPRQRQRPAESCRPHPTPRSRSEISGGSRLFLRGDSGQHFIQPPDSRERRACRITRRADWIWLCILQITQGYAEQRETGRARARRTSLGDGARPVHYHTEPSARRRLRAILKGGRSHVFDRVLGRRGGHRCRGVEDGGPLLGRGPAQSVPAPQAWVIHARPRRGGRTLAEHQQPPGFSEGKHRGESGGVWAAPQGSPRHEGIGGPDVFRYDGRPE